MLQAIIAWFRGLFLKAPPKPVEPPPAKAPPPPAPPIPPGVPEAHKHIMGVDVSHYESGFDFVKGVKDGVIFMMTKASEGTGIDTTCVNECVKAKLAGVKYTGVYHFFHANIAIPDQLKTYFGQYYQALPEMPPILDLEETSVNGVHLTTVKDNALLWLQLAEETSGKTPILYVDLNMSNILALNNDSRFDKYPRWIAKYSSTEPPIHWTFWQYTDRGEQGADTDWFSGDESDLQKFLKGGN